MVDQEKVIYGLQEAAAYFRSSFDAMYGTFACEKFRNWTDSIEQALALLKAQEPRVMTLEELEDWDGAVFFEAFETDMYYALIENVELTAGMDGEYVLVNVVPGEHNRRIWGGEYYGSIWRCWTSRPSDEVRRATPWSADGECRDGDT